MQLTIWLAGLLAGWPTGVSLESNRSAGGRAHNGQARRQAKQVLLCSGSESVARAPAKRQQQHTNSNRLLAQLTQSWASQEQASASCHLSSKALNAGVIFGQLKESSSSSIAGVAQNWLARVWSATRDIWMARQTGASLI